MRRSDGGLVGELTTQFFEQFKVDYAVIGVSAAQISALINTQLAASLGNGRISWITYADRLREFPTASRADLPS